MTAVQAYVRSDGRVGVRNLVLNVPVVVCATLVSAEVASQTGAVTVTHQHGCGHIGDDVDHTRDTYVALATHPNVAESLVFSLGCETLQGPRVAQMIEAAGGTTQLIGIQESGGAEPATAMGLNAAAAAKARRLEERTSVSTGQLAIGFVLQRHSESALRLVAKAHHEGFRILLAGRTDLVTDAIARLGQPVAELSYADPVDAALSAWYEDEAGSTAALTLALSGAHAVVVAPDPGQLPTAVPVAPIVVLGSDSGLHALLRDDIDLMEDADTDEAWSLVVDVVNGMPSRLEQRADGDVVIPRLRRTM